MAEQVYNVYCETDPTYYLTEKDGSVVMAAANAADPHQHWTLETSYWTGGDPRDEEGNPGFGLKNKASGLLLKHAKLVAGEQVSLGPFLEHDLNTRLLWTRPDAGNGYNRIRPVEYINLTLDAKDGYVGVGSQLILYPWSNAMNQRWKISPLAG